MEPVVAIVDPPQCGIEMAFGNKHSQTIRSDRPLDRPAPGGFFRLHLNKLREKGQVGLAQRELRRQFRAEVLK